MLKFDMLGVVSIIVFGVILETQYLVITYDKLPPNNFFRHV